MEPATTPLPLNALELTAAHTLLLVGGTFDPPHIGHVLVPQAVRAATFPGGPCVAHAWLIYIPAAQSPLKSSGPAADNAHRLRMLELALHGVPSTRIWTDELDRAKDNPRPSFTIDTLRRARAWLDASGAGHVGMRLVIGADQAVDFHRWREAKEIIRIAEPLVMTRAGYGGAERVLQGLVDSGFWTIEEVHRWKSRLVAVEVAGTAYSSTSIREALGKGALPDGLRPEVVEYIRAEGLYRGAG